MWSKSQCCSRGTLYKAYKKYCNKVGLLKRCPVLLAQAPAGGARRGAGFCAQRCGGPSFVLAGPNLNILKDLYALVERFVEACASTTGGGVKGLLLTLRPCLEDQFPASPALYLFVIPSLQCRGEVVNRWQCVRLRLKAVGVANSVAG